MANLSSFGSSIKSIQAGTIDITSTSASATATITAVVTAKSFVVFGGAVCTVGTPTFENTNAHVVLTNTTTVTATRRAPTASTTQVSYSVVEFY